jgi:enolase
LIADDLFTANTKCIGIGIDRGIANTALRKMNQISKLTDTLDAVDVTWMFIYSIQFICNTLAELLFTRSVFKDLYY